MNRSEFVFAAIDVLFHPFQNYIKIKGLEHEKNVRYSDDHKRNVMDLIYPKTDEPLPVLLNIHGGGFVKGDKKHRRSIAELYAEKGWFVINMNYRLAPKNPFPAAMEDVFKLLQLLPSLAEQYNLDLNRFVVTGDSAGGYMSAHTVAILNDETLREGLNLPKTDIKVTGLMPFCGLFDVMKLLSLKIPFGFVRNMAKSITGMKLDRKMTQIKDFPLLPYFSPGDYINANWPPTHLAYSKKDIFCKGQGEWFYDALKNVGVEVTEVHATALGDNHCYHFNFWTKTSKKTMQAAFDFLEKRKNA